MKGNSGIEKVKTGIEGLDEVLYGGIVPNRSYVVRGGPGTGKTTLGIQYLYEGVRNNEKCLLITLAEEKDKIVEEFSNKFGTLFDKINILDLSPSSSIITKNKSYSIFEPKEVEWEELLKNITSAIEEVEPNRIYLDGITQLEYMSNNKYEYRKNILSLVNYIKEIGATILISSEAGEFINDEDLQFISDGIFELEYVNSQRNLIIKKIRNSNFSTGKHSIKLTDHGMVVFPILKEYNSSNKEYSVEIISSGISSLDKLLNGGIEKGSSNIFSGPSGVGKTTLGIQFIKAAAENGIHSIMYSFEERLNVIVKRSDSINIPIDQIIKNGVLKIRSINPISYSPNEFSQLVKKDIEKSNAKLVMIDSITGFRLLFEDNVYSERDIIRSLHVLINYLTNENITVILINEVASIIGDQFKVTDYGISYLADNVIFMRYLEVNGRMEKSIGILKKRLSDFEKNLRAFQITENGIEVGKPLLRLRGILTGNPDFIGENDN